jgi:DNA replication protein DnaC
MADTGTDFGAALDGFASSLAALAAARSASPRATPAPALGWKRTQVDGVLVVSVTGCPVCRDTGTETDERDGYAYAVTCSKCGTQRAQADRFTRATLPARLEAARLGNFEARSPGMATALQRARGLAERSRALPGDDDLSGGSMVLVGERGAGKTHFMVGLARELLARRTVRFIEEPDLLEQIKSTFDSKKAGARERILDPLVAADVLMLDEFGRAAGTDWSTTTIGELINQRWRRGRPTIVATNWTPAALEERLGGHIMRRLLDGSVPLAFGGS